MTPEQAKLLDECINSYIDWWQTPENCDDVLETRREVQKCKDLRSALQQLIAEHAAMREALRWRAFPDSEPDENATVFYRRAAEEIGDEVGSCFGGELNDGDEWLPVPT